jgi:hypothetical protein
MAIATVIQTIKIALTDIATKCDISLLRMYLSLSFSFALRLSQVEGNPFIIMEQM